MDLDKGHSLPLTHPHQALNQNIEKLQISSDHTKNTVKPHECHMDKLMEEKDNRRADIR